MPRAKPEVALIPVGLRLHPDTVGTLDFARGTVSRSAFVADLIAAEGWTADFLSAAPPKPLKAPVAREKRPSRVIEALAEANITGPRAYHTYQVGPPPVRAGDRLKKGK